MISYHGHALSAGQVISCSLRLASGLRERRPIHVRDELVLLADVTVLLRFVSTALSGAATPCGGAFRLSLGS